MAQFVANNNGISVREVGDNYQPQVGEVLFPSFPTEQQLAGAFPGYAAAKAILQLPGVFANKIALGIQVISAGTPAISATYALDQQTQDDLSGTAATAALLGAFPDGGQTYTYPDINSNPITFPSLASFKLFYAAYAGMVLALRQTLASGLAGGPVVWPSQVVHIA